LVAASGGVQAALRLARLPVEVTLVDRNNYFLFQLLAYQVATGGLSPAEIAYPLRRIFRRHRNVRVILAEVTDFDLEARIVQLSPVEGADAPASLAFEAAELEPDAERRAAWLTFSVIGTGPTGVEMAGQIAEMACDLRSDFREPDCPEVQVLLVEAGDRVLSGFPPSLSKKARRSLDRLGINTRLRHTVVNLDDRSVTLMTPGEPPDHIRARTVVWAAGVVASDMAGVLANRAGTEMDRAGRIGVGPDLSLPGHPEVLALGDMSRLHTDDGLELPLPGTAPVATQRGATPHASYATVCRAARAHRSGTATGETSPRSGA
jgi:NADH dehydrogenase